MESFKETQRIRLWWLWAFVGILNVLFLYAFLRQVIFNKPFGSIAAPNGLLAGLAIFSLLLLVFLFLLQLRTRIDETGIHYKFSPFHLKYTTITWYNVSDAYMRQYEPLYEFEGWGIRGNEKNKAISMSGKFGLQLVLRNGGKLIIGTRKPVEIKAIAQYYFRP
jgi:Family of unknown function (DUF6141)